MRAPRGRVALAIATAVYLAAVAWMTLSPQPYDPEAGEALRRILAWLAGYPATAWITYDLVEFTANVVMFVPLGVIVVLWAGIRRWWAAPIAALVLSTAIEFMQTLLPTRYPDARDVVANTLGAALGMLAMLVIARGARTTAAGRSA